MNTTKRVMAIIGIVILVGLYLTTFFLAIFGDDNTLKLLNASIVATVIVPVLLWVYFWLYKMLRKDVQDTAAKQAEKNQDNLNQ